MRGDKAAPRIDGNVGCIASVIICAYTERRWDLLCDAVRSVREQTRPPDDIILVIDYNSDLLERARLAFGGVTVIPNTGRRGLSGARNSGVRLASGEIIAFIDDDAIAAPDWLAALLTSYDRASIMGVGGYAAAGWQSGRPAWFPSEFDWVVGCSYRGLPTQRAPVRNVIGCNMSFRREVFRTVGLFQETMGRVGSGLEGCEETELCIRTRRASPEFEIVYDPSARILHHVPEGRSRWRYFLARCWGEGKSKSQITSLFGQRGGLKSERFYVTRVLPVAVLRALGETVRRANPMALLRAIAIVSGLAAGVFGYTVASARRLLPTRTGSDQPDYAPPYLAAGPVGGGTEQSERFR